MGSNVVDELECGSYFDHIDDLIEFPAENDNSLGFGNCNDFPSIWINNSEGLPCSDPIFSCGNSNSVADLSAELDVPYEDIVQLEWLSTFVEDSFSGRGLTMNEENIPMRIEASHKQFQTSSPVSVLESSSSSSCSGGKTIPLSPTQRGPQRSRSKRPRPATFNPRSAMQLISPTSCVTETHHHVQVPMISYESENFAESHPMKIPKPAAPEQKKKKKPKISFLSDPMEMGQIEPSQSQAAVRKCMHCEITKTPQWRAGPMGPKTLCNACGVRYKSGRLFPEYRPAASPTFVPSLHSNSHKKVIEMRVKGSGKNIPKGIFTPVPTEPVLIPNKNASVDHM